MALAEPAPTTASRNRSELHAAWRELRSMRGMRNRDAAEFLDVSEAALLDSAVGDGVTRLAGDLRDIVREAPSLGTVMAFRSSV